MALTIRRLLRESPPIALILLLWGIATWAGSAHPSVAGSVRIAGFVVATLFAVVRGVSLSTDAVPVFTDPDPTAVLVDAIRPLAAAAPWFLAALFVQAVVGLWRLIVRFGLFTSPARALVELFANTGLLVVVLFAVATGTAAVRDALGGRSSTAVTDRGSS